MGLHLLWLLVPPAEPNNNRWSKHKVRPLYMSANLQLAGLHLECPVSQHTVQRCFHLHSELLDKYLYCRVAMSKRKEAPSAEVNLDLKNAAEEVECVTVDRVVGNISPMKTGKKSRYFEAKMTDGEVQMRVVGFKGTQKWKLMSFFRE